MKWIFGSPSAHCLPAILAGHQEVPALLQASLPCTLGWQVTDTTTFTDEKRRAEVDSWLYETCTRTLQHIVEIVVQVTKDLPAFCVLPERASFFLCCLCQFARCLYRQEQLGKLLEGEPASPCMLCKLPPCFHFQLPFLASACQGLHFAAVRSAPYATYTCMCATLCTQYYSSVSSLLDRILDLLLGFIRRTHQALAAVGVAAMTRLILAAGSQMDEPTWLVVSRMPGLASVLAALPDCLPGGVPRD